jgi:hypothetical protein
MISTAMFHGVVLYRLLQVASQRLLFLDAKCRLICQAHPGRWTALKA